MLKGERPEIMLHYVWQVLTNGWAWLCSVLVAAAAAYWGAAPEALRAVLQAVAVCTVADTILGVVAAFACPGRKFSSNALASVIYKLLVYSMTLLACYGVDKVALQVIGSTCLFQLLLGSMIVFRETMSVIEFSALLGVKWPDGFKQKLDLARKQVESCFDEQIGNGTPSGDARDNDTSER